MKPLFQRLTSEPQEGFVFKHYRARGFDCPWHVHPEYEIILVLEGRGYRIVGDNMAVLSPGDLVFVGPGLPHIWQEEASDARATVRTFLIQFEEQFLGETLLKLPAFEPVRRLFVNAGRGLHVIGPTRKKVSALMQQMPGTKGLERLLQFLEILNLLANSDDCRTIASPGFAANFGSYDQERMDRVYQFLAARIAQNLRISEVANLVHLSEGAFSRFFRTHTGKTFPEFVNELRIGRACRLLTESEENITEVAYASGFANLSNFNRQFLRLKGLSPRGFRNQMHQRLVGS
ncbi:MAG: AraC family transcriptional regulator [Verrucomicrobia bacterium]|nr:MAG: AraC family transcriptional regulator [Verrucomicrobiota bacterium]